MPPLLLILDEWIFHHLEGQAGPERQEEAIRLLEEIQRRCDQIAWRPQTPWARKAYKLMNKQEPVVRIASKLLHGLLRDSNKGRIITVSTDSPPEVHSKIPEDDRYLVEICLSARDALLVTTDQKLYEVIAPHIRRVQLLDDFLKTYGLRP